MAQRRTEDDLIREEDEWNWWPGLFRWLQQERYNLPPGYSPSAQRDMLPDRDGE